jgi:hypothetical protein
MGVRHAIVKIIIASHVPGAIRGVNIAVGLLRAKIIKSVIFDEERLFASVVRQVVPRSLTMSLAAPFVVPHKYFVRSRKYSGR